MQELADDYFEKQKKTIKRYSEAILTIFAEEAGSQLGLPSLTSDVRQRASDAIDHLVTKQGYPRPAIPEVLAALVKSRY